MDAVSQLTAHNHINTGGASHSKVIKIIVSAILKEYITLKLQLRAKLKAKHKLDNNAHFIPRSAKFDCKLTFTESVMEKEEFKTLSTAMDEKITEFHKFAEVHHMHLQTCS